MAPMTGCMSFIPFLHLPAPPSTSRSATTLPLTSLSEKLQAAVVPICSCCAARHIELHAGRVGAGATLPLAFVGGPLAGLACRCLTASGPWQHCNGLPRCCLQQQKQSLSAAPVSG